MTISHDAVQILSAFLDQACQLSVDRKCRVLNLRKLPLDYLLTGHDLIWGRWRGLRHVDAERRNETQSIAQEMLYSYAMQQSRLGRRAIAVNVTVSLIGVKMSDEGGKVDCAAICMHCLHCP